MRFEALARVFSVGRQYPPFWRYPAISLVAGLVLGAFLGQFQDVDGGVVSFAVYQGDADAARSFVSLSATSLATITTFTLTTTVLSIQLASSQHSPRLIEHYLSDRATLSVFSLFLGSFAFSIATLLNIRLPGVDEDLGQVPGISISVLVALMVASLAALVFFIHRVTSSMRIEAILRRVRDRSVAAIDQRRSGDADDDPESLPDPPADGRPVRSRRAGYYTEIDWDRVEAFSPDDPCRVWMIVAPGDFVAVGSPVALVTGAVDDDTADEIESWMRFDSERWIESDFSYGVRNLVDIALKALSPGVNDPTTATMAIERIGETLAVAGRGHPERAVRTDAGTEVYIAIREWDDTLWSTVRQIVEFGKRDVAVVTAVLRMLAGLAWAETDIDRRPTIRALADQLRGWISIDVERVPWDIERIDDEFTLLAQALDHDPLADRWHPL